MLCRINDFKYKDVVNAGDGVRLGYVGDVELDTESAALTAIVIRRAVPAVRAAGAGGGHRHPLGGHPGHRRGHHPGALPCHQKKRPAAQAVNFV